MMEHGQIPKPPDVRNVTKLVVLVTLLPIMDVLTVNLDISVNQKTENTVLQPAQMVTGPTLSITLVIHATTLVQPVPETEKITVTLVMEFTSSTNNIVSNHVMMDIMD